MRAYAPDDKPRRWRSFHLAVRHVVALGLTMLLAGTWAPSVEADGAILYLPYLSRSNDVVPEHEFVGMVGGPSWILAVLSEEQVLVGDGPHVVTMDATDPANMREVGRTPPLRGLPLGIDVDLARNVAVVALSPDAIVTLDVRDPAQPIVLGRLLIAPPADVRDVRLGGGGAWAVVAAGHGGLITVDLSDPAAPRRLAGLDLGHPTARVRVEGALAIALPEIGLLYPERESIVAPTYLPAVVDLHSPARPQFLSHLVYQDATGTVPPVSDLVLSRGRAYFVPTPDSFSCVYVFDLSTPESPRSGAPACIPFLSRLIADYQRQVLFAIDTVGAIRVLDSSGPDLEIIESVGQPAGPIPSVFGPTIVHRDRMFMAADERQPWLESGDFADRPRLDWRPQRSALHVFELQGKGDLNMVGRRAHSMDRVRQMSVVGGTALAVVDLQPRQLSPRTVVLALDPQSPGQREIVWPLSGSRALLADGETLYALQPIDDRMQFQRWDARNPRRPKRQAFIDFPPMPFPWRQPEGLDWSMSPDDSTLWVGGAPPAPMLSVEHSMLVAVSTEGNGALGVTSVLTLEQRVGDIEVVGPYLAVNTDRSLLLLDTDEARQGRVRVVSDTALPWISRGHMAVWDGKLVLAERDIALYEIQDGRPVEVATFAFDRDDDYSGWYTSAMMVREDRLHLSGTHGLRSFRLSPTGIELDSASADLPAARHWNARTWPGRLTAHSYETIVAIDDYLIADRRELKALDEPLQPAGFTIWRVPGDALGR